MCAQARTPKFTRRRKGKNPTLAVVVAIVILLAGCWIFNWACGGEKGVNTSDLNEYVNSMRPIIDTSTALGQQWNAIRADLTQLIASPDVLNEQLRSVEEQCGELLEQARIPKAPGGLELAHAALLICLEQRYRAMKNFRPDLVNALQAVDVQVYSQSIAEDLQEVVYSDGSYRYYRRVVADKLGETNVAEAAVPESVWLPDIREAAADRVAGLLVALKGTEVHGLALGTAALNPEGRVGEVHGETVHFLPSTGEVAVTVNVQNQGNRAETDVVVSLSIYSEADTTPSKQEQTIPTIGPGETLKVEFSGLVPKTGGVRNVLEIKVAPVPQEAFVDNNQKLIYFIIE